MSTSLTKRIARITLIAAACMSSAMTWAQTGDYPTRPIRIVSPAAPGGSLDILSRLLARQVQAESGVTMIVDNRPGASGSIGVQNVVSAPPDGYTILVSVADAVSIYPLVNDKVRYRWEKDLTPLVQVGTGSSLYAVAAGSSLNSIADLVALARKEQIGYASQGLGTSGHLMLEALIGATGIKGTHVPYKGIAPAIMGVAGGEAVVTSASLASLAPHLASGKMKALATTRKERYPSLPDVPTMAELGYKDIVLETWFGILAPAGLPPQITDKLTAILLKGVNSAAFREQLEKMGTEVKIESGRAFTETIAADAKFWQSIVERAGVKLTD